MDKVDVRFPTEKPKSSAASNLPRTAEERATALVGLMQRLAAHLDRESEAVLSRRPLAELARLAQEKQPMMLVYEEVSRLLRIDTDGVARLAPELKRGLSEATRTLRTAAAANAETLRVRGNTQKILVDTVVGAINRARHADPGVAYGPAPTVRGYGPPSHGPGTAATLNTRL